LDHGLQQQLLANEITTYQVEKKYLCQSGAVITGRLTASLVRSSDGKPDYLVAQVQDVTQFKASGAALREAEARYRTLVEQIPAAVYIDAADELGITTYISPRIETMLGYSPAEWISGGVLWKNHVHPADRDRVLRAADRSNQTGVPFDVEYRMRARDGRDVWVSDSASLLFADDGSPQCWHGMMIDINERKRAEDELRAAKEAAEEASRLKSTFLSMATHELRTPLTIISGYVELLAGSAKSHLTPEELDYLLVAQSGAATLAGLVDDLLDLARIEAGRMELQLRQVDVREAMERVRGLVHGQAVAKGLDLRIDIDADVPTISADLNRVAQILLNLFANAIKFTNEGAIVGTVRTRDEGVEIAIADTGIGISPEALPRIFDEFRQVDSGTTRRFGGSGLGLAIVKRLVEMHAGTVAAESEVGAGSRFTVWFPAFVPDAAELAEANPEDVLVAR
jgi:PAS domain S-box-containing protein